MMDDETQTEERFPAEYIRSLKAECARYRIACKDAKKQAEDLQAELEVLQSGPSEELLEAREDLARFERQLADLEAGEQKKG